MLILAFTDIHGSYDTVEKIISSEKSDVIIFGGDITNVGSKKEVELFLNRFTHLNKLIYCIAGNMDLPDHDELYYEKGIGLSGNGIIYKDVGFFGVSGSSYTTLNTPYEVDESTINKKLLSGYLKVLNSKIKILVSHTPPYKTKLDIIKSEVHVGSKSVRNFIEKYKPEITICGHIHEARGLDKLGDTQIVNCGLASQGNYARIIIQDSRQIFIQIRELR